MKIKTICRDCLFAKWEGNSQTGCEIGRLSKFQDLDSQKVTREESDGKSYYAIDRICNYCRNDEWKEKHSPGGAEGTTDNLIDIIRREILPKIDFIVLADSLAQAITSIKSAVQQTVKPSSIIVISKSRYVCEDARQYLRKNAGEISYKVIYIFDEGKEEDKTVNEAVRQCKGSMYTVLTEGGTVQTNLVETIDRLINEELKQPVVFYNKDGTLNGLTVSHRLHEMLGGNGKRNIVDKAQELATREGRMDMLISWDDLLAETASGN